MRNVDSSSVEFPGANNGRPGGEVANNHGSGSNNPNLQDRGPTASNQESTGVDRTSDSTGADRIRNDEGANSADRSSLTGPGREGSSGDGYSSLPGRGEGFSEGGSRDGSSNNRDGTSGAPNGGRYDGESNRPPHNLPQKNIDPTDERYLGDNRRFGTDKDGNEVKLDPNSMYVVDGRGTFITDSGGKIIHVETQPGQTRKGNPELVYPRPDAKYFVEHPTSGAKFVYQTDDRARTVSVEGELKQGWTPRSAEQTAIGHEGKSYFKKLNQMDPSRIYEDVDWEGGHLLSGSMLGGPGERINLVPMLKNLNQAWGGENYRTSWGKLEYLWNGILGKDRSELMKAFGDGYVDENSRNKNDLVEHWLGLAEQGGQQPSVTFKIEVDYNDSSKFPNFDRGDLYKEKPGVGGRVSTDKGRPGGMGEVGAPPEYLTVDWSLNGVPERQIVHENHPDSRPGGS